MATSKNLKAPSKLQFNPTEKHVNSIFTRTQSSIFSAPPSLTRVKKFTQAFLHLTPLQVLGTVPYFCEKRNWKFLSSAPMQRFAELIWNKTSPTNVFFFFHLREFNYWVRVSCWSGLPCLVEHLTWFHMSDYHHFWNPQKIIVKKQIIFH